MRHAGSSSLTWDESSSLTWAPCIGNLKSCHWSTREVPLYNFNQSTFAFIPTQFYIFLFWKWTNIQKSIHVIMLMIKVNTDNVHSSYFYIKQLCVYLQIIKGLSWFLSGKEFTWKAGDCLRCRRYGFYPWDRKRPWRRIWQPTPVFMLRKSHEQRKLEGYSPRGQKKLDTTATTPPQSIQVNLERPNNCFNYVFISGCGEALLLLTGFL